MNPPKTAAQFWRQRWVFADLQFNAHQLLAFQLQFQGHQNHADHYQQVSRMFRHDAIECEHNHWACSVDQPACNEDTFTPPQEGATT